MSTIRSGDDKLDPRLIEALARIEALEIENRQLKAKPRTLFDRVRYALPYVSAPAEPFRGGFDPKVNVEQGWVDPNITMGAPLGFDSGGSKLVAPGESFRLVSRPKELFTCERFIIGSDIADLIDVKGISIGGQEQLDIGKNEFIPGTVFSHLVIGPKLNFKRAQPGEDIVFEGRVSPDAKAPIRVLATVFGAATLRK